MKHLYPAYYSDFHCIAAACPDSCCQGWDVVIDSDTEAFYNTVQGNFGEKLRGAIYTDSDGDRVFRLAKDKKCPFWGADKLCDIYKELGEPHLCATCAQFPRLIMDYTVFCEHTLALACPEAARLILTTENAYREFSDTDCAECEDYPADVMRFLLQTRQKAAHILTSDKPLSARLSELIAYTQEAQQTLTENSPGTEPSYPEIYPDLEYIDEADRNRILQAAHTAVDLSRYEKELTALSLYYLYRYLLGAIDTFDLLAPVRFLRASVFVVAALARQSDDIITAAQLYSKEIEQSYENTEKLWAFFGAYTD